MGLPTYWKEGGISIIFIIAVVEKEKKVFLATKNLLKSKFSPFITTTELQSRPF